MSLGGYSPWGYKASDMTKGISAAQRKPSGDNNDSVAPKNTLVRTTYIKKSIAQVSQTKQVFYLNYEINCQILRFSPWRLKGLK